MNLLEGINKRLTNAVTGVTFNQDAFDEAHARPLALSELSEVSTPKYLTEEEWSTLTEGGPRAHDQVDLRDDFEVMESPAVAVKHLGIKITQAAVEKAAIAADVGQEYAKFALQYIAAEARRPVPYSSTAASHTNAQVSHDISWITKSKTMMDVFSTVKERFPLLQDIKTVYRKGRQARKEERQYKLRGNHPPLKTAAQPPNASKTRKSTEQHPFSDLSHRKGSRMDSTNQDNTFEDVPLNEPSDDDYDADIDIDEQEDELYAAKSAERYFDKEPAGGKVDEDIADVDDEDERALEAELQDIEEGKAGQAERNIMKGNDKNEQALEADCDSDEKDADGQKSPYQLSDTEAKGYFSKYFVRR